MTLSLSVLPMLETNLGCGVPDLAKLGHLSKIFIWLDRNKDDDDGGKKVELFIE